MTITTTPDALAERIFGSTLGALDVLAIQVGVELGWYAALAEHGPATAGEIAVATGTHPRYVREWLEHQAVGSVIDVDDVTAEAEDRRYSLPAAHAEVLLNRESLAYVAPIARLIVVAGQLMPDFLAAYRTGGGVPWTAFGAEGREAQAALTRPLYTNVFAQEWLPTLPEVHEKLSRGGRVADVACGAGWSSIGIAKAYPDARVDGYDVDPASIDLARANADAAGVADRVTFHVRDVAEGPAAGRDYDLVCVLEALHDMARPVEALSFMRSLAGDGGTVLVMDERVAESFTVPGDEMERIFYGFSLFCCLPTGMAEAPSAATGTVMRPHTLRDYVRAAGFADVEVLDIEHPQFRLYRVV
jgi:ubiquinone/menaquinone biosynthesis C-methylase UbiE